MYIFHVLKFCGYITVGAQFFTFPSLTHRRGRPLYMSAAPPDGIESSSEDEVGFQLSSMAVETAQVCTFASCVHIIIPRTLFALVIYLLLGEIV